MGPPQNITLPFLQISFMSTLSIFQRSICSFRSKSPFLGNAGAVATIVRDLIAEGVKPETQTVLGKKTGTLSWNKFYIIKTRHKWLYGKNIGFAAAYCNHLKYNSLPNIIEVHGRCNVAAYLLKKKPTIPISLYVYSDPREMAGAKSAKERQTLLRGLVRGICVSNFIRGCFLDGLNQKNAI